MHIRIRLLIWLPTKSKWDTRSVHCEDNSCRVGKNCLVVLAPLLQECFNKFSPYPFYIRRQVLPGWVGVDTLE